MKKLVTILIAVLISSVSISSEKLTDYVITKDGVQYFNRLNHNFSGFLTGNTMNGEKVKFSEEDVLVYRLKGKTFEKRPLIVDNIPTSKYVFMEAVDFKNGLKLLKHDSNDKNGVVLSKFYIFKKDHYVVDINSNNYLQLIFFFENKL